MKFSVITKGLIFIALACLSNSHSVQAAESIMAVKAKESLLLDVQKLSNGRLIAVGERGHILISDDQGETWEQKQVPTQSALTAVDFYDDQWGVAVGFEQTVLITKDGGDTWTLTHQEKDAIENPALFDVEFVELNKIIAVGAFGLYLESNDGGDSWNQREVAALADFYGGFSHFYGLAHQAGSKTLYLAGEKYVASESEYGEEVSSGLIAVSNDNGQTWTKLSSPYDGSFFGVKVAPDQRLFVYGLKGNLFSSNNAGASWQAIDLDTNSGLHDIVFLNGDWVAVGTSGTIVGSQLELQQREDLKGRAALVNLGDELLIVGEGGIEKLSITKAAATD
ncbi:MAG: hypothetical protein HWE16_10280 [Gammaproteobacteria bacterium]|nr:hypothetical protein [Gammaproteobacteria bacterium]